MLKRIHRYTGLAFVIGMSAALAAEAAGSNGGEREPDASGRTVSAAVYARAEALLGSNLIKQVRNYFIVPHWIGNSDEFWYRHELEGGHEFILVDAATGRKQPAFDHAALAAALGKAMGKALAAKNLPFDELELSPDRDALQLTVEGASYTCSLQPASCGARKAAPAISEAILVSPDGRYGVETRADNDLWLHDLRSGKVRALTDSGEPDYGWGLYPDNRADFVPRRYSGKRSPPANTQWAPNSRLLLVPLIDQRHVEPYPFVESVRKDGSHRPRLHSIRIPLVGERPASFIWYLIDVQTGEQRRVELPYDELILIQQDFIAVRDFFWTRDSRRLFMVAHGDNLQSGYLFEVDTDTGAARAVITESDRPRMEFNSTSYNAPNVRVIRDGKEAIWWSQRDGWGHLYRYDIASGRLMNRITSGNWLVRDIIEVDEQRERIFFTAGGSRPGNPYYRHLYRVNFDGTDLKLLTPEDSDHLLLPDKEWVLSGDGIEPYPPLSPSGKYVVYNHSRVDQPTRFVIRRVDDAGLVATVAEADASGLYASGWRPPEEFMVTAPDGKSQLWGTIYKPSDFDPSKSYPVIDAQYASPLTAITPRHFYQAFRGRQPLAPSSYAELGFIVVSLDARGTTFRSKQFSQYGFGQLNLIGLDDHVHAITTLARQRPYMDLDRVGIVGHSYGGYTAVRAMLEFPKFFKVGISSAGPADMHVLYNDYHWAAYHGKPRYSNGSEWIGDDKTEIPANWRNLAGSLQAQQLEGKLLMQFGELDENVPPSSVFQFIDALIAANKDFDMLYLPSRDHGFIGEGYVMRRNWDYMVRHLAGKEPPREYRIDAVGR